MAVGGFGPDLGGPVWAGMSRTGEEQGPGLRSEEERLRTFTLWPRDTPVTPADLARAGFYFLGYGDTVRCFCCAGVLRRWVQGDEPLGEHRRHFPSCSFVLGREVGNVPRPPGSPDSVDGQLLSQLQRMGVEEPAAGGQAVYPEMETEDSRLATFHSWDPGAAVQPHDLARAGFFYTGPYDHQTHGLNHSQNFYLSLSAVGLQLVSVWFVILGVSSF